jgi:hypothetical protein
MRKFVAVNKTIITATNIYKMTLYPKLITEALGKVRYPGSGKTLVEAGMVAGDILTERHLPARHCYESPMGIRL